MPDEPGSAPPPSVAVFIPVPCIDRYLAVSALPGAGWKVAGEDLGDLDGGVGGNFAVAAARLGATVHAIGWAGRDEPSRRAVEALQRQGVDVSLIRTRSSYPPYRTTVLVDERGERGVVLLPPPEDPRLLEPDWPGALAALAPALCYVGPWDALAARMADAARAAGAVVAATLETDSVEASGFDWGTLQAVDLLFLSREAAISAGWSAASPAAVPSRLAGGPEIVVITSGTEGSRIVARGDGATDLVPAFKVATIDTTGAGDTFAAAFCTAWVEGLRGRGLLLHANAAGALATTALGPRAGMPARSQVEELVRGVDPG
jgi:sugar/nucleoside kinase (ribokinase family)